MDAGRAERELVAVLRDLLAMDGIDLINAVRPEADGTDFIGFDSIDSGRVGVEYKHYAPSRAVDVASVHQVLNLARRAELTRVILISNSGFSAAAVEAARLSEP